MLPRRSSRLTSWLLNSANGSSVCSSHVAVRTSDNNDITIWVAYPCLAMARVAVHVRLLKKFDVQVTSPLHCPVEFVCLKPEKDTIPPRCRLDVTHVRMHVSIPAVQLKNQIAAH